VLTHINKDKQKTEGQQQMFQIFRDIENCPPDLLSSNRRYELFTKALSFRFETLKVNWVNKVKLKQFDFRHDLTGEKHFSNQSCSQFNPIYQNKTTKYSFLSKTFHMLIPYDYNILVPL
jgi:hypothetical protein